ncbi:hypothetical protein CBR_g34727 [Chara braunii]|uniref:NADP-dependent oxidoreductase domain-containing protein n=1 Tax=Chara braunii TaxID=69332 RepID=A0A388JZ29_CHABU|nr:hypothetical protein CBR_g34727 [Chara braunii]|eukprot:GBG63027.1 hypothetical protein CBR_g34727 [Chara braunii]
MALTAGGHQELEAPGRSSDRSCERSLSGQSGGACIAEDELWPKLCTGMEASSQPARDGGQENAAAAGGTEVGAEEAAERAMVVPRRALGKTGMEVSILGYGASPLGGVYGDVNEKDVIQSVRDAIEAGINFFDVSPYYGLGSAEKLLGKALQGIPREKFILSTKVGRYGLDEFDFSAERVTRSVDESLQRLGLDYLDIVLCHDIEFGSIHQVVSETIPALQRLKTAGKLRFIGVSGFPLKIFKLVLDELEPGTLDVVLSYCRCGLNDESLADMLPYLEEKGVGVISASPLSMGLLTDVGPPAWHPAPQALKVAHDVDIAQNRLCMLGGVDAFSSCLIRCSSRAVHGRPWQTLLGKQFDHPLGLKSLCLGRTPRCRYWASVHLRRILVRISEAIVWSGMHNGSNVPRARQAFRAEILAQEISVSFASWKPGRDCSVRIWTEEALSCMNNSKYDNKEISMNEVFEVKSRFPDLVFSPVDRNVGEIVLVCPKLYYEAMGDLFVRSS